MTLLAIVSTFLRFTFSRLCPLLNVAHTLFFLLCFIFTHYKTFIVEVAVFFCFIWHFFYYVRGYRVCISIKSSMSFVFDSFLQTILTNLSTFSITVLKCTSDFYFYFFFHSTYSYIFMFRFSTLFLYQK
nr:hypothetical protein SPAC2F7.12 - fission yeast (Schizosaccharomyces pombe) [Schizosaccharomyces pombe]